MSKLAALVLCSVPIGLILGWLLELAFTVITGILLLLPLPLIISRANSASTGYRRIYVKTKGPILVFSGKKSKESRGFDNESISRNESIYILFISISCITLMAVGLYWMHVLGQI